MTNCTYQLELFQGYRHRKIEVNFEGGNVTSDGGVLFVREADRILDLTRRAAAMIHDPRRQASCIHEVREMLKQRVYGLCLGYEDLNDHDDLRKDAAIQTAVERDKDLASSPTLCRFESWADRQVAMKINELLMDMFIESHKYPQEEIIL
ncbi:transposase [bacterium]|nr:transposase [candidate division CSSED10-310 bacterium]